MATWARGIDFKNTNNTKRIGGVGVYGTDTNTEKLYIGMGSEPWNNTGLQLTSSSINFKGNKIYHAGDKPTASEIGAAASSHTHNYAGSSSAGGAANLVYLPRVGGSSVSANYQPGGNRFELKEFANDCANMPSAHWYHILTGQGSDANYNTQLALGMTNNAVYFRNRNSGAWGNWKQLAFTDSSITGNSATATKLKTARTINGTNFDGSGNITTANWGTARTITIGNTGKSVNGSGNVAWSLSEIGAAASNHSHNVLSTKGTNTIGTTTDDTTAKWGAQGNSIHWYTKSGCLNNQPSQYGYILNLGSGTEVHQLWMTQASGNLAHRGGNGSGWNGTWRVLLDSSNYTNYAAASNHTHNYLPLSGGTLTGNLKINGNSKNLTIGTGGSDVYISNSASGKYLQLKDDGTLSYSDNKIYHSGNKPTASEIGAAASNHTHNYIPLSGSTSITGTLRTSGELQTTSANAFRAVNGNYGFFIRNDGSSTYFMLTNSGDQYGNWNSLRPMSINNSSGLVTFGNGLKGSLDGNAATATKLQTARAINGTSFDGSANITTANWGTARNLNGVSVNGSTNYTIPVENYYCNVGDNNTNLYHRILTTDIATTNYVDKSLIIVMHSGYQGGGFGIAKITLRTNDISSAANSQGEIKWLVRNGFAANALVFNFVNQAKNACMDVFYKSPGTYAGMTWYVLSEGGRGGAHSKQWTKYNTNASGTNAYTEANMKTLRTYTSTLVSATDAGHVSTANSANTLATARTINGTSFNGSGNITTANWGTARNLQIGNTAKSVNGSANVTWTLSEIGAAAASHTHNYAATSHNHGLLHDSFGVTIANTTTDNGWSMINSSYNGFLLKSLRSNSNAPAWLQGNYSAGIAFGGGDTKGVMSVSYNSPSVRFAGGNGSKPVWYFTVNGSSGKTYNMDSLAANTANTLTTARTINGTSFNGSANITTANWGTARNIQIGNTSKSVNGSGNVSWSLSEIGAAASSHTHNDYLPLSGGTVSGSIKSSLNTGTYLEGNKGKALLSSTNSAGSYTTLLKSNSTNGYFTLNNYQKNLILAYTAKTVVDAGTNSTTKQAILLDETGNTSFPGTVTATTFNGNASTATKLQTARAIKIGNTSRNFDGSANLSWSLNDIGAAASNHSHNYLPLSGGTITGETVFNDYLSLNAWPGYGTGKAHLWFDGNSKNLIVENASTLKLGNNVVYHTANKPTAKDIGALPLTGGILTGETTFKDYLSINAWSGYGTGKSQLWFDGNSKNLIIENTSTLRLGNNIVYHTANKPTPADIGAIPTSKITINKTAPSNPSTGDLWISW